jgi:hypothetical protein
MVDQNDRSVAQGDGALALAPRGISAGQKAQVVALGDKIFAIVVDGLEKDAGTAVLSLLSVTAATIRCVSEELDMPLSDALDAACSDLRRLAAAAE